MQETGSHGRNHVKGGIEGSLGITARERGISNHLHQQGSSLQGSWGWGWRWGVEVGRPWEKIVLLTPTDGRKEGASSAL